MTVPWSVMEQLELRNLLIDGEMDGSRTQDPRLKMAMKNTRHFSR